MLLEKNDAKLLFIWRCVVKKLYLLCNAHLDPAWLWRKDEGRAAAISTFRVAADFCEDYEGFVFNHNEALLYEWIEKEEPELFARIKRLVKEGKWNVIGGTYLQADCNIPNGESFIRQIQYGQRYFKEKLGVSTDMAFHMDAFGHSRGLVQIFKKMGYQYYIFMRPGKIRSVPNFQWEGFDGSRICGHHLWKSYSTRFGEAANRIEECIQNLPDDENHLIFWGIGDHGGGPSRIDMEEIAKLQDKYPHVQIIHSNGKQYFDEIEKEKLPVVKTSLRPSMVGCYTSVIRIKQEHRRLENLRAMTEKIVAHAGIDVDHCEWDNAEKAILFNEFHDILPGTLIRSAEEDALREMNYAGEIFERYITNAFFKLCQGQRKAKSGEVPVLVYNPHPYPVEADVEAEFQLDNQNWNDGEYTVAYVYDKDGNFVPVQHEKPECSLSLDWRKRVVFHTVLAPMTMNRFDCILEVKKDYKMIAPFKETEKDIFVCSEKSQMRISKSTGLMESFIVDGKERLKPGSGKICVFEDNEDPWAMQVDSFTKYKGEFTLADEETAMKFGGCAPIEVIENGEVRTKVQSIFNYSYSFAVVTYIISKYDAMPQVHIELFSNDRCVMYKYCITPALEEGKMYGQTAFGTEELSVDERENCYQQWCGLENKDSGFYVLNRGNYGGSSDGKELRISLLRTACYAAHPIFDRQLVPSGRFNDYIDMGKREFTFQFVVDKEGVDREAQLFNEGIRALSFFPSGDGEMLPGILKIKEPHILLTAITKDEMGCYCFRLYNAGDKACDANISCQGHDFVVSFNNFEVKRMKFYNDQLTQEQFIG